MTLRTNRRLVTVFAAGCALCGCAHGQSHAEHGPTFGNADAWVTHFENPHRDTWQKPDEVVVALGIEPAMRIADIGAATGYFAVRLARQAREGRVWAIDIEPEMVRYVNRRARRQGIDNLVGILATPTDPMLPESVDLVLLVDTYHHIHDRVPYFTRVREQLRPGGRIAIVDFRPGDGLMGPPPAMRLPLEQVQAELAEAGFVLLQSLDFLPYQYLLVFGIVP